MWRSLVAHFVRDEGVGGSNPLIPTNISKITLPEYPGTKFKTCRFRVCGLWFLLNLTLPIGSLIQIYIDPTIGDDARIKALKLF